MGEKFEKQDVQFFDKTIGNGGSNLSIRVEHDQMTKPSMVNHISVSGSANTPSEGGSKRLRLVGTGTLNIEPNPYDHELVSMRLTTFNEVIHWNMEPSRMKPKRRDPISLVLKARNALKNSSEILVIHIKSKDIVDSLMTILSSIQIYYEAETKDRDDDDMDSDESDVEAKDESDSKSGGDTHILSLAADHTISEHQAEIDRAVFLIENSKKHENIKTVDIAKFLVAKSCPFSVIEHAFIQANVPMPIEVYEMTGMSQPKKGSKRVSGKSELKGTKFLGIGLHGSSKRLSGSPLQLSQSLSGNAEDEDWWCPPDTILAVADQDSRYQEALIQHDIRFCSIDKLDKNGGISSALPSDKLDQQLRLRINRVAVRSGNKKLSSDNKKIKKNGKLKKLRKKMKKGRSK